MRKLLEREKIRFLITGFFNTGFDFIMLNTLVFLLGAYPIVGNTISVTIGITVSYILNHKFVFQDEGKLSFRKYIGFFAVTGFSSLIIQNSVIFLYQSLAAHQVGFSIPIIFMILGNDVIRLNVAKASGVLAGMIWNFTMYKFVIFRKKKIDTRHERKDTELTEVDN